MFIKTSKFFALTFLVGSLSISPLEPVQARSIAPPPESKRQVDLVIALDVSGSMSGLIDSAKQRLWDIVNELGQARPSPELRVSIVSFGNPGYGQDKGYVRIDQPFTGDLDAVNATLFAFGTNGGDEYVARAIDTSLRQLQWSTSPDALRIIFVAGNESATQDPQMSLQQVTQQAREMGVVVNSIYCGNEADAIAAGWQEFAQLSGGMYASIDQNAAAVANIETPMDARLVKLNKELNETYIGYGAKAEESSANQLEQDKNAAMMSKPAAAARAVTKSSALYDSADWDLVDALKSGVELEQVEEQDLPEPLQAMAPQERLAHVQQQGEKRKKLQQEIAELGRQRRDHIAHQREQMKDATATAPGLDEVIQQGLRKVAEAKGFEFEDGR
jgi:hypothetical protein